MEEIEEELTLVISPRRKDVYRVMADVFEQRENLNKKGPRFDDQIMTTGERLNQAAKQHQHLASLPIGQPDPIEYQRGHGVSETRMARLIGEGSPPRRSRNKTSSHASARRKSSDQPRLNIPRSGGGGSNPCYTLTGTVSNISK